MVESVVRFLSIEICVFSMNAILALINLINRSISENQPCAKITNQNRKIFGTSFCLNITNFVKIKDSYMSIQIRDFHICALAVTKKMKNILDPPSDRWFRNPVFSRSSCPLKHRFLWADPLGRSFRWDLTREILVLIKSGRFLRSHHPVFRNPPFHDHQKGHFVGSFLKGLTGRSSYVMLFCNQ